MSRFPHFDHKAGDTVDLLRCDLCGLTELDGTGVAETEVEHPHRCVVHVLDLCRACEADGYDKAQALVADLHGTPVAEPLPTVTEPDAAEQRIEDERDRWERIGESA